MKYITNKFNILREVAQLFYRRIPYVVVFAVCLYFMTFLATIGFYAVMPGNYFLNVKSAQVADLQLGQELQMTLCRDTTVPNIKADSTRSFYRLIKNGKSTPVSEYEFKATYEEDKNCLVVHIPQSKYPNQSGDYYIHTESSFYVYDGDIRFKKEISYDTNHFHIYDTQKSLEQQIQDLQQQLQHLKDQVAAEQLAPVVIVPKTQSHASAPVKTSPAPSQQPVSNPTPPPPKNPTPKPTGITGFVNDTLLNVEGFLGL